MAESKRFLLRLNPRLFEAIRRWADDDLRSINAQIEYLLTDQARRAGRLRQQRTAPRPPDMTSLDEDEDAVMNPRESLPEAGVSGRSRSAR
jgi:hypothetical protein